MLNYCGVYSATMLLLFGYRVAAQSTGFASGNWTWLSGSSSFNQVGTYGVKGKAGPSNVPGARTWSAMSFDRNSKSVLLFGGGNVAPGVIKMKLIFEFVLKAMVTT